MSTERIIKALDQSKDALEGLRAVFQDDQPDHAQFEAAMERDREARKEYAAALIEQGWTVPEGLLDDVPEDERPEGVT